MGCATLPEHYVSLHNLRASSFEEILHQIKNEKVIFIGEGHGIKEDHLVQFEVVRHLHENGKDVVIALEMFPSEAQSILNQWIRGEVSESDFKKAYYSVWNVPYEYYSKIFEYARQVGIPLAGINGNEAFINNVAKTGVEKLPEYFRKEVKVPSCAGAPEYSRMIDLFEAKIAHVSEMPFVCDAQLLRDSLMAYNIVKILQRDRFTIVALVGSTHALRVAVPRILFKYYNVNSVVLVSKKFADIVSPESDAEIADYIWY
jgi:uncharacterized iron-regulated protein